MSRYGLREMSLEDLLSFLIASAIRRWDYIRFGEGTAQEAGKAERREFAAHKELKRRGLPSRLRLLGLLRHNEPAVRLSAASWSLEIAPAEAAPVLEQLSRDEKNLIGFSAEKTLEVWKKGALKLP